MVAIPKCLTLHGYARTSYVSAESVLWRYYWFAFCCLSSHATCESFWFGNVNEITIILYQSWLKFATMEIIKCNVKSEESIERNKFKFYFKFKFRDFMQHFVRIDYFFWTVINSVVKTIALLTIIHRPNFEEFSQGGCLKTCHKFNFYHWLLVVNIFGGKCFGILYSCIHFVDSFLSRLAVRIVKLTMR